MNRVLKVNNKFQVLVTPVFVSNSSMEILLGNWTDERIRGYKVLEFSTLQDAMDLAFKYPSIDWNKLVSIHEDAYQRITKSIRQTLEDGNYIVELDSHLMDPTELKETMFKRVAHRGERFSLFYDANDVVCVNIVNPWTQNVIEISNLLKSLPDLRIKKYIRTPTHIKLIGITDVDTVYEIRLWTTVVSQWVRWINTNKLEPKMYVDMLPQILANQKTIDSGYIVR